MAADLLSQAEHDRLASAVLLTDSWELAQAVDREVVRQTGYLERSEIMEESLRDFGCAIVCDSLERCVELANEIAPEHLEIMTEEPRALGDRKGLRRFASACIPMDEALCFTVLDFSNRPFLVFDADMPQPMIGTYDPCLTEEFLRALAVNSGLTLHMKCLYGKNAHHITEALFKSLGAAVKEAVQITGTGVTSTKGVL